MSQIAAIDRDDLLALLEDGPKDVEQLAHWVASDIASAQTTLLQMEKARLVRRVGAERRWALAGYQASPARPHLQLPAPRGARHVPTALRQEDDRPDAVPLTSADRGSWWTTAAAQGDRHAFADAQRGEHERMRTSPMARQVKSYILGGGGNVS